MKLKDVLTDQEIVLIHSGKKQVMITFHFLDSICFLRQCPVDAMWSSWGEWGLCSSNCKKKGQSLPIQSRSRICFPEQFFGKSCRDLEQEESRNNKAGLSEEQNCTVPMCPSPASLGPWSEWSDCSQECVGEGEAMPQSHRKRECKKESINIDFDLASFLMSRKPCH